MARDFFNQYLNTKMRDKEAEILQYFPKARYQFGIIVQMLKLYNWKKNRGLFELDEITINCDRSFLMEKLTDDASKRQPNRHPKILKVADLFTLDPDRKNLLLLMATRCSSGSIQPENLDKNHSSRFDIASEFIFKEDSEAFFTKWH
jgi:hypothetical protein